MENVKKKNFQFSNPAILQKVSTNRILLTFDDGPRPNLTPKILDILSEYQAKACFFVIGNRSLSHKHLLKRMSDEGHQVGNHTWSHLRLMKASKTQILEEVKKTQYLIEDTIGQPVQYFRPPFGQISIEMARLLSDELKLTTMHWSLDPSDWSSPGIEVLYERINQQISGGDIVLLHEKQQTTKALPAILSMLNNRKLLCQT